MQYYEKILASLRTSAPEQAERLEEEINILVHKLKFLPSDSFPSVAILQQNDDFQPVESESLNDKVKIAGGTLLTKSATDPHVLLILKNDDSLYSALPALLEREWIKNSPAFLENRVFIIESDRFGQESNFLPDIEILAEILQPKYFYFGHEGNQWTKFELIHS